MACNCVSRLVLMQGAALCVWFGIAAPSMAETAAAKPAPTVEACRAMIDRIARLQCFDTVFNVSIPQPPPELPVFPTETKPVAKGPIRTIAENQERGRALDQRGWVIRFRPWAENMFFSSDNFRDIRVSAANREPDGTANRHRWTEENVDVFLTLPESDASADRPLRDVADKALLMAACENDITSLYVVLPRPLTDPRARLILTSDRGTVFSVKWRDVEQGDVIAAGRGLESIDFIKSLASFRRVQLQLQDEKELRAFTFDIEDLAAKLPPLRTACHW